MRFALTAVVCVLLSSAAFAGETEVESSSLFEETRDSLLSVSGYVWYNRGRTNIVAGTSTKYTNGQNYMALLEGRFYLPGVPWVGFHGRFGTTLSDSGGEAGGVLDGDCEADFTLTEFNVLFTLAGRHSPLTPDHALPHSYIDAFAGVRMFTEEYDCEGDVEFETDWFGVQVGLRGEWAMADTYGEDSPFRQFSVSGEVALLPWLTNDGELSSGGSTIVEHEADWAYGAELSVALNYRYRFMKFTVGYMWQRLRADEGDAEFLGSDTDLYEIRSSRRGVFLGASLAF
ncbi:MAG: hypothetical protein ACYTGB_06345 [Planctomycetota bacterium]|jgi:hypothetical protein